ncbi:MAG: hypothetical protein RJA61_274 [Candidatus Parcubacteria bacterium]
MSAEVTYIPLVSDLPGVTANQPINLASYLGALYKILIGSTIALAFVVITFEGLKHMGSESPFAKSEASRRIGEAIGGIILAVMSWLILYTINPDLVSFKFLKTAENAAKTVPQTSSKPPANPVDTSGLTPPATQAGQKFCFKFLSSSTQRSQFQCINKTGSETSAQTEDRCLTAMISVSRDSDDKVVVPCVDAFTSKETLGL